MHFYTRIRHTLFRVSADERSPHDQRITNLAYARGNIQVEDEFVAMVFASQILTTAAARKRVNANLRDLSRACEIPETKLRAAAKQLRVVEPTHADKILRMLTQVAETFSQIGRRRLDLLRRLRRVAQIAGN
jgi:hypothetical protein